jgi:hypothetical protein
MSARSIIWNTRRGVLCMDSSPKLRYDWDSDYEDSLPGHEKGCDRAFLEVIYAPVPQAQTSTVG